MAFCSYITLHFYSSSLYVIMSWRINANNRECCMSYGHKRTVLNHSRFSFFTFEHETVLKPGLIVPSHGLLWDLPF